MRLAIAILIGLIALIAALPEDSVLLLPLQREGQFLDSLAFRCYPMVHLVHNSFLVWCDEPLMDLINRLGFQNDAVVSAKLSLIVLLIGSTLLFHHIMAPERLGYAVLLAAGLAFVNASLFGFDRVLVSAIAWLPMLSWLIARATGPNRRLIDLASFSVGAFFCAFSSGQLAAVILAAACALGLSLARPGLHGKTQERSFAFLPLLICAGCAALALLRIPALPFPDYPPLAHVVPYDGLPGITQPLIGPQTPLPVIDRNAVRATYASAGMLVFLSFLVFLAVDRLLQLFIRPAQCLLTTGLAASLVVVLDTWLPPAWSLIAPLAALSRLMPFLYFFPLAPVFLALALFVLLLALMYSRSRRFINVALIHIFALPVCAFLIKHSPLLAPPGFDYAWTQSQRSAQSENLAVHHAILTSPSYHLLNKEGLWVLEERERIKHTIFEPLKPQEVSITTSHSSQAQLIRNLVDGKPRRRWSPKRGYQAGDEWLHLYLKTPRPVAAIELSTGQFLADFPRGIRLSYLPECAEPLPGEPAGSASYSVLIDHPSWQGEILFTPAGFPYYGTQSEVRIHFPRVIEAQCLFIEQTARDLNFDWSVAKIALGKPPA